VGNFLGDFVKGRPEVLRESLPDRVVWGIEMHRSVDAFTDNHEAFARARELLAPERRRFAGIVVDVIFDYFLAERWEEFCEEPFEDFVERSYEQLAKGEEWMDIETKRVFGVMRRDDWLRAYASKEGIALTLRNVKPIAGGMADFEKNESLLRQSFSEIFPDLQKLVGAMNRNS